ncbi:MAG TPA: LysR family transcriptional regulator [Solirubrobacteraceae bacterium]
MAAITLTGLQVLRAVADRGSFTAAAEGLGYTQSAISRQVASLEAAAGATMFRRGAGGTELTEAGRVLLGHAVDVLDRLDGAQRELDALHDTARGRLRVGAFATAVAALLPRALAAFRQTHPSVAVTLREGSTLAQLRRVAAGGVDAAVVSSLERLDDSRLRFEPLLDDPLLLAVPRTHALAGRRSVALDDLASERWISASTDPNQTLLGTWDAPGWEPDVVFIAREWTAKLGLVAAGLGVTLVPGLAAIAVRDDVALVRVRADPPVARRVVLATREGEPDAPHLAAFVDTLHAVAAALGAEIQQRVQR